MWHNCATFRHFSYSRVKFQFKNWNLSQTVWPNWAEFLLWATVSQNTDNTTLISLTECDQMGQNFYCLSKLWNQYSNWSLTVWPNFTNFCQLDFSQTKFWYQNVFILTCNQIGLNFPIWATLMGQFGIFLNKAFLYFHLNVSKHGLLDILRF